MSGSKGKQGTSSSGFPEINFYGGVRRACDACRKKKIRCDAQQPCGVCRKSGASCQYNYVPKKKGPKAARVKTSTEEKSSSPPKTAGSPYVQQSASTEESPSPHSFQQFQTSPTSSASLNHLLSPIVDTGFGAFEFAPDLHRYSTDQLQHGVSPDSYVSCHSNASPQAPGDPTMIPSLSDFQRYDAGIENFGAQLPGHVLRPFVELFFQQMFPIMPVLDREVYLGSDLLRRMESLPSEEYSLLTALSAVTIVQLNLTPEFVHSVSPALSAELLVKECFRERQQCDYIENPNTSTVLTSFFLFCYHGQQEKHNKALHYLHESISFAESIDLDDEVQLSRYPFREGQWRRRIFWLLFVTERGYALQCQNRVKIQNISIDLPAIFESEEPCLLYGFVNLVNLFLAIDGTFFAVLKGQKSMLCSKQWLIEVQKKLDASASSMTMIGESSETQQLDIKISRQWLRVLAWKISVKHGLLSLGSEEEPFNLNYPIQLARDLVKTTSAASQLSLDSHGIGMEQKIADITGCLTDVLKCADGDTSEPFLQGREYLFALLKQLSSMRGVESRYLQPLLLKSDSLINQLFSPMSMFPRGGFDVGNMDGYHGGVIEEEYDYDL